MSHEKILIKKQMNRMNRHGSGWRQEQKNEPYPKHKDSGVEWIGEVPEHWNVAPIRSFAKSDYKAFTDGDWIESPYIREEGICLIQTGNIGISEFRIPGENRT